MAALVVEGVLQVWDDGTLKLIAVNTNPSEAPGFAEPAPGAAAPPDPWAASAGATSAGSSPSWQPSAPTQWTAPVSPTVPAQATQAATVPTCAHGPLKAVAGGIAGPNARNPGKPYDPFWACQAARGETKCRLDQKSLPSVAQFLQSAQPPF